MVGRIPVMDVMPFVDLGRLPAKATVGEPFPSRRPCSARATTSSAPRSCWPARTASAARRCGWSSTARSRTATTPGSPPTPRAPGPSRCRPGPTRSRTWQHDAGLKIPAGVDVELMFTEGAAAARPGRAPTSTSTAHGAGAASTARSTAADDTDAPGRGPARGAAGPRARRACCRPPAARAGHGRGPLPARTPTGQRALFSSWYEFFPRSEGATYDAKTGTVTSGTFRTAAEAARRRGGDGLRRDLPAADPPDRRGQPQGPQQHPRPRRPTTPARPGRSARKDGGHDAIHPDLGTFEDFDAFVATRRRARASRSRSTSPCSARPTTRG